MLRLVDRRGSSNDDHGADAPAGSSPVAGPRIIAALETLFNVIALNLVLLAACVPIVTIPAALHSASVSIDRWREEGEDRLALEFLRAFRRDGWRATIVLGPPLVAIAIGLEEAHFFALRSTVSGRICFGLGLGALVFTATAIGYVLLLSARERALPVGELWSRAARLALLNLATTGPLFIVELAAAIYLLLVDPALCLAGVPALLVLTLIATAKIGVDRLERRDASL